MLSTVPHQNRTRFMCNWPCTRCREMESTHLVKKKEGRRKRENGVALDWEKLLEEVARRGCSRLLEEVARVHPGKRGCSVPGGPQEVARVPHAGIGAGRGRKPRNHRKKSKMCRGGVDIDPSKRGGGSAGFQKFPLVKTVRGQNFLSTRSLLKLSRPMKQAGRDLSESTLISDTEYIWRRDPLDPV